MKDLSFGPWLRASPLPKQFGDSRKATTGASRNKSLFAGTSDSKTGDCGAKGGKVEVDQVAATLGTENEGMVHAGGGVKASQEVERVAESLGTVALTILEVESTGKVTNNSPSSQKWKRIKGRENRLHQPHLCQGEV